MKALRDIYKLKINEPFKQLFTQGMITHKTYKTKSNDWVMPKDIAEIDGKFIHSKTKEEIIEGPSEKMSKSKKNVIEPNEILENFGIDATRIFMISDSPPDRELEWTDQGIQSSKNLVHRIERYFDHEEISINDKIIKKVELFIYEMEKNILNFSLNKCVANIYTLFNYLEKNKYFLGNHDLSKKILICLFPIIPGLANSLYFRFFQKNIMDGDWPSINLKLIEEVDLTIPIQINGKLISTIKTKKDYNEKVLLDQIYNLDKIKTKISNKEILKVINVQNKIINIIAK